MIDGPTPDRDAAPAPTPGEPRRPGPDADEEGGDPRAELLSRIRGLRFRVEANRLFGWELPLSLPPAPPAGSKRIYLTNTPFVVGVDVPDTKCDADKPAGTGAVKALLATTGASASDYLDAGTKHNYTHPENHTAAHHTQHESYDVVLKELGKAKVDEQYHGDFDDGMAQSYLSTRPWRLIAFG